MDTSLITQKMTEVRNRGLVNARELGEEVERLGDWREHVRAHPVPLALAAAAVGFWVVPSRTQRTAAEQLVGKSPNHRQTTDETLRSSSIAGMGGAVMGFVGSMIGNAVRSYVSQQVHSLIQGGDRNAAYEERPTSSFRNY